MTASTRDQLLDQLIVHEGLRLKPYMDTVGKITIGVGRNLSDKGLSRGEMMTLLDNDVDEVIADLATFPWFLTLDPVRQRVVADLRFNVGPSRFREFKRTLRAFAEQNYPMAAKGLRESMWAQQVKSRATRLIAMTLTGQDT